jgi:UDP-3-O-[3-hydroxymyristoyl] N-acetylglucosamine deacetylase
LTLNNNQDNVFGVEHLLSAIEAYGINNAIIEVNGGNEIPIIDGSSLGWTQKFDEIGLKYSPKCYQISENNRINKKTNKFDIKLDKILQVNENDSFIMYQPDNVSKLTVGIDYTKVSPIIGKNWFTYTINEDNHYKWVISPARMYMTSLDEYYKNKDLGYYKAGIENCVNIAYGKDWYDDNQLRFINNECVRHEILDLIGCLSLLNYEGNTGIPLGHIIAYKPTLKLMMNFVKLLKESFIANTII